MLDDLLRIARFWGFVAFVIFGFLAAMLIADAAYRKALGRDGGQWEATTPEIREWYRTLMQPDYPSVSCCGEADAYYADEVHVENGQTYAVITDTRDDGPLGRQHIEPGTRVPVPDHKLKWDRGNPTGHNVIFINNNTDMAVLCFVQGGGV